MRRFMIIALATLGLVLLSSLPPATAKMQVTESYIWGFAHVGSNQVVCKEIATARLTDRPLPQDKQAVKIRSKIVSDRYCAKLRKLAR